MNITILTVVLAIWLVAISSVTPPVYSHRSPSHRDWHCARHLHSGRSGDPL